LGLTPDGTDGDRDQPFDPIALPSGFELTLVGFANPTSGGFIINPATFVFTFNPLKINELHQIFIVYLIAGLLTRQSNK